MISKHDVMRAISATAHSNNIASLATPRYGGAGTIFMLHSIIPDDDYLPRENIHTTVGFLESTIRYYLMRRVPIVSLSEAMARLKSGSTERFVSFTFDDGYRDNLTLALPVFRKYNLPFTVYIASSYLERRHEEYWWGQVRHLVRDNDHISGDYWEKPISMKTPREKIAAYRTLSHAIDSGKVDMARVETLFDRYKVSLTEVLDRDAMTWSELGIAARTEHLLEIGGHTDSHAHLSTLEEQTALDDIRRNKTAIENVIDRPVRHFCYPYGDAASCGPRDFELARIAGYETATTTRMGNLFPAHIDTPWALPRMRFIGPCETIAFMETQRSGAFNAMMSRLGNPVVTA